MTVLLSHGVALHQHGSDTVSDLAESTAVKSLTCSSCAADMHRLQHVIWLLQVKLQGKNSSLQTGKHQKTFTTCMCPDTSVA